MRGEENANYLRNFGVTTFHFHQLLHVKEPVLYLAIVTVDCVDDCRIDYFGRAVSNKYKIFY